MAKQLASMKTRRQTQAYDSSVTGLHRRLNRIAEIIEMVENRCMASDGPVGRTISEMTNDELKEIYRLATGSM